MATSTDHALKGQARRVLIDERVINLLSISEQIAVAFVLDRTDLFPRDYTMLDAYNRLGPEMAEVALRVQRTGLHCEEIAHG
ncbi:MAG TPA: hypothetical protein VK580_10830 [Steroidobacteraceae bacterium]|nr:hypothetical protein [Steroidobacteraceae bacterium]